MDQHKTKETEGGREGTKVVVDEGTERAVEAIFVNRPKVILV